MNGLAQGDATKIEIVLNMNFRMACTHKAFEVTHREITDFYAYKRYSIPAQVRPR